MLKTARNSSSKTPYQCKQNWEENCFCQCGGEGIVFTGKDSLEKAFEEPQKTIKTVLGEKTDQDHYRTAFFEAFPRSPSCYLRGEGKSIEEAELNAWNKYQKILSCKTHDWNRRDRVDGYCFCTKCPLSGTFLEPLTKCEVCKIPTTGQTNKDDKHYCLDHYFKLVPDEVVDMNQKSFLGFTPTKRKINFIEKQLLFNSASEITKVDNELWKKIYDLYFQFRIEIEVHYNPLFGKKSKTDDEIHEMMKSSMPVILEKIKSFLKL